MQGLLHLDHAWASLYGVSVLRGWLPALPLIMRSSLLLSFLCYHAHLKGTVFGQSYPRSGKVYGKWKARRDSQPLPDSSVEAIC